ncbi:MAG: transposase [Gammaproteobacteria bacterium]
MQARYAAQCEALEAAVGSALRGRCLTVTGLGRWMQGSAQETLYQARRPAVVGPPPAGQVVGLYGALTGWLVGSQPHPVFLIDWSDLDKAKRHQVLRAALVVAGRALTLYEEVHGPQTALKADTQERFLQRLKALLPAGCVPVLVTDAGFRTPWFKAVERMKWYWVARIRHRHFVRLTANGGGVARGCT